MKKILIFHPYLAPYRVDFFNKLNELFVLKVYFQYKNDPAQNFDLKVIKEKSKFEYDYLLEGFKILKRQIRFNISKIIIKEKPNLIITHEFAFFSLYVQLYKLLFFRKYKHFITTDDSLAILNNLPRHRKISKFILLNLIDGLITISSESKIWHVSKYHRLKDKVFDLPIIQNEVVFQNELQKALPISDAFYKKFDLINKKVLLFVGRLVTVKGIEILVDEFIKISDDKVMLVIVGDGELKSCIQKKISENNEKRILLVGRYDGLELVSWYNLASGFILPSTYEPFGAVVNEALMSGLYTLCSKYAGASVLVKKNINGDIFDPLNKFEFRYKLLEFIESIKEIKDPQVKQNLMDISFEDKMKDLYNFLIK